MSDKNPNNIIKKLSKTYSVDDARNHIRNVLGSDPQNTVFQDYDAFLEQGGKGGYLDNGTYPKGHYNTILGDNDFLKEVAQYIDQDNYYGDRPLASDQDIEAILKQKGYRFR